ncbi:cytochrome c [Novosphingobium sp. RD2P27]|uniref:Cytochrome c n=1 Tax=Novosphingobium kalidii TaxID=3230299 RepID=A0ABV2D2D6_9SPHN
MKKRMMSLPSFSRFHILAALTLAGVAAPLLAAPADAVRARIAGYKHLGAAFKAVNDGLRRPSPDKAELLGAARTIRQSAAQQYKWFPRGSGPQAGVKTAAKAAIWTDPVKFKQAQDAFAAKAVALERAVASGDAGAIRSASRSLGATCKGCHDQFRSES